MTEKWISPQEYRDFAQEMLDGYLKDGDFSEPRFQNMSAMMPYAQGWKVILNTRAGRRKYQWTTMLGRVSFRKRTLELTATFLAKNKEKEILDTILHEIAHILAGPGMEHGPHWKAVCCTIGARPSAFAKYENN